MGDFYGQGSNQPTDDDVVLASSRPKKPAGRKKFKETRHPVYRGVRQRNGDRWVCEVRTPTDNSRIWLGTYPTAEMAARAHDVAALALRGQMACLNFADSAWRLPVPASTDTGDIQRAAAEAAELFHPARLDNADEDNNVGVQYGDGSVGDHQNSQMMMNNNSYSNEVEPNDMTSSSLGMYIDEEAMFNMPSLIHSMAEGMLIPPPRNASWGWEDTESDQCDVSLWNF